MTEVYQPALSTQWRVRFLEHASADQQDFQQGSKLEDWQQSEDQSSVRGKLIQKKFEILLTKKLLFTINGYTFLQVIRLGLSSNNRKTVVITSTISTRRTPHLPARWETSLWLPQTQKGWRQTITLQLNKVMAMFLIQYKGFAISLFPRTSARKIHH